MNSRFGPFGFLVAPLLLVAACSSSPPPAPVASSPPPATSVPSATAAATVGQSAATPAQSPPSAADQPTRTSEGGQVTVVATWAGPPAGAVFDLTLDTHSVDLDALDLADAILRNDRSEALTARPWSAPAGGHHRAGTLSFNGDAISFFASARWIELVLTGIGDLPERTLRWEISG